MDTEVRNEYRAQLREISSGSPFLSMSAAARFLHRDVRTLQRDSTFPRKRIGKRDLVPVERLAVWLAKEA